MNENLFEVLRAFRLDTKPCASSPSTRSCPARASMTSATPSASVRQLQQRMKKALSKMEMSLDRARTQFKLVAGMEKNGTQCRKS